MFLQADLLAGGDGGKQDAARAEALRGVRVDQRAAQCLVFLPSMQTGSPLGSYCCPDADLEIRHAASAAVFGERRLCKE